LNIPNLLLDLTSLIVPVQNYSRRISQFSMRKSILTTLIYSILKIIRFNENWKHKSMITMNWQLLQTN